MYISMYILYTLVCTLYIRGILHLSFMLLCTFPRNVLVDTFVYDRAIQESVTAEKFVNLPVVAACVFTLSVEFHFVRSGWSLHERSLVTALGK